ncbi:hypothetical protein GCM10027285_02260 [Oleiagrimonas citrea]|uniref:Uncharacterized protein n=1 Tax=Oleiagrimonas citrea TaxID=1665687 RepID=A0A846ZNX8_9GAMM|nr:hypothetical protein [Oleiagrimonas citrea]NKZ39975.1 hypothetical protein [Oleiagrimonas citrea]
MDIQSHRPASHRPARAACASLAMCMLVALAAPSQAGDAHKAVKAKHGEMVLLRDVPARHATHSQPPGVALIVNPKPNRELESALGTGGELGDAEIASLSASPAAAGHVTGTRVTQLLRTTTRNGTGSSQVSHNNAPPGTNPMSTVGSATRGIDPQVQRALSALPLPTQPGNR